MKFFVEVVVEKHLNINVLIQRQKKNELHAERPTPVKFYIYKGFV